MKENDEPVSRSERYSLMEDEDWRTRGGNIWNGTQRTVTRVKCRATTCQLVQLVKFMEKHPELAVSHAKPFPGSDELWVKLADHINQFGPPKTYKQCKTTWRDLRKRAFSMHRSRSKKETGRNLYGMAPKIISLITQAGMAPRHKEVEGCASSSRPDTPPQREPPVPTPASAEDDSGSKTEKTKGEQLVIRVTDTLNSKRNVCNRFTISDGHFENVIVKEEMMEAYNQEEEDPEPPEPELGDESHESGEMFPQPEAILGSVDEVMEEKNSVIRELNDTLRKFLTEYKTRNALMRERIDLERARLQFDMEVYRSRQMENRVIAVNAANAANIMKTANAMSVANSGNAISVANSGNAVSIANSGNAISVANLGNAISVANSGNAVSIANSGNAISIANSGNSNNITVGASAGNAITVNAGAATVNTATAVKPNPVITLNPLSTRSSGNAIAVKIENTVSVRNANVANATNSANAADSTNVAKVENVDNIAKAVDDGNANIAEDSMDET